MYDNGFIAIPPQQGNSQPLPFAIKMLIAYLGAITIFGKGPTYLFYPPLYWGEIVLVLLGIWAFFHLTYSRDSGIFFGVLTLVILAFMFFGAFFTLTGIKTYGMMAVRDAAVWYYSVFYFFGLMITRIPHVADKVFRYIVLFWLCAMIWQTVNFVTHGFLVNLSPVLPWRGMRLLEGSGSENVQQMSFGGLALLLGFPKNLRAQHYIFVIFITICCIGVLLMTGGRGVRIAVLMAAFTGWIATVGFKRSLWPASRRFVVIALLVIFAGIYTIYSGPERIASMVHLDRFGSLKYMETKGTAAWRLAWWESIADTVQAESPWCGLGFGQSLSEYSPYLEGRNEAHQVRAPHNINVTFFARMGYIGATMWGIILLVGISRLFIAVRRGGAGNRVYTLDRHKELCLWLMFVIATYINSSFGVLMEGPVLGIWFWFALGFGLGRANAPDAFEAQNDTRMPFLISGQTLQQPPYWT